MKSFLALASASLIAIAGTAQAETMTFSGVTGDTIKAGGYTEDGITATNTVNRFWGYDGAGTLHLDRGASNGFYDFTFANGAFDLLSFSLLGNSAGSTATIAGFNAVGTETKTGSFTLSGPTQSFADWTNLSRVRITATGTHFSIDNFAIAAATGAVPEPATWAMMLVGFGAVGFGMRSAKRRSDSKFDAKIKRMTAGLPA